MQLPDLTPSDDDLRMLERKLGGCDFSGDPQRRFLAANSSCDVQAAPGSGKTTLLVAKLLHVVSRWARRPGGVCVLSHTNAARREVEEKLGKTATSELLAYPNFVGTLTSFINRFIALPYLRGLGWPVREIDNDRFAVLAEGLYWRDDFLRKQFRKQATYLTIAKTLTISTGITPTKGEPSNPCPVQDRPGLPGPTTDTRRAFERIKGTLTAAGIYRYEDMAVFAEKALDACPALAPLLVGRFPLVVLDEAQDTSEWHMRLLVRAFAGGVIQRLGDCNQTLYEHGQCWVPADGHVDLGQSRRFTSVIASFASRLTVRRPQSILGRDGEQGAPRPTLLVYPDDAPTTVLPAFAEVVNQCLDADADAWAVGWVHRQSDSPNGLCLQHYEPTYRPPGPSRTSADALHIVVSNAHKVINEGGALAAAVGSMYRALLRLARLQSVQGLDAPLSDRRFRRWLKVEHPVVSADLTAVLHEVLLGAGCAPTSTTSWPRTRDLLLRAMRPLWDERNLASRAERFLRAPDADENREADGPVGVQRTSVELACGTVMRVNLGSVAHVKGRTHDATLVVQTKYGNVKDVKTALEVAAGLKPPPSGKPKLLKAVTNVFVGSTRPRHLLCLALPASDAPKKLRQAVADWEWTIVEAQPLPPPSPTSG